MAKSLPKFQLGLIVKSQVYKRYASESKMQMMVRILHNCHFNFSAIDFFLCNVYEHFLWPCQIKYIRIEDEEEAFITSGDPKLHCLLNECFGLVFVLLLLSALYHGIA